MNNPLQHPNYACRPSTTMPWINSQKSMLYELSSPPFLNLPNIKRHPLTRSTPLSECILPCSISMTLPVRSLPNEEPDMHEDLNQNTKTRTLLERMALSNSELIPLFLRGHQLKKGTRRITIPMARIRINRRYFSHSQPRTYKKNGPESRPRQKISQPRRGFYWNVLHHD